MPLEMTAEAFKTAVLKRMDEGLPFTQSLYEVLDQYREAAYAAESSQPVCEKQCSACCHQVPWLSPDEMELIWRNLEYRPRERRFWRERVKKAAAEWNEFAWRHSRNMHQRPEAVRANWHGKPCPLLLADGSCGVYEARPLVCRTTTALKRCGSIADIPTDAAFARRNRYDHEAFAEELRERYDEIRGQKELPLHQLLARTPTRI